MAKLSKKAKIRVTELHQKRDVLLAGRHPNELNDEERHQLVAIMEEFEKLGCFKMGKDVQYQNEVEDED